MIKYLTQFNYKGDIYYIKDVATANLVAGKLNSPSTPGVSGQVLTVTQNGTAWVTPKDTASGLTKPIALKVSGDVEGTVTTDLTSDVTLSVTLSPDLVIDASQVSGLVFDYTHLENLPDLTVYAKADNVYSKDEIDAKQFITRESDPTVPDWAKQPTKPEYSYSEIKDAPDPGVLSAHVEDRNLIITLG